MFLWNYMLFNSHSSSVKLFFATHKITSALWALSRQASERRREVCTETCSTPKRQSTEEVRDTWRGGMYVGFRSLAWGLVENRFNFCTCVHLQRAVVHWPHCFFSLFCSLCFIHLLKMLSLNFEIFGDTFYALCLPWVFLAHAKLNGVLYARCSRVGLGCFWPILHKLCGAYRGAYLSDVVRSHKFCGAFIAVVVYSHALWLTCNNLHV